MNLRNRKNKDRDVPELNTTSTADISFMLLIFFLVTTSMDSEKGLGRQLPPYVKEKQEAAQDVNKDLVMTVEIATDGKVKVNGTPRRLDETLRKEVRHFIIEKGRYHIIELQFDRDTKYDDYFHVQNLLARAYREVRDAASRKKYGKTFVECTPEERAVISAVYPQRIQEQALSAAHI